jgi:sialic acid synthase SpsE
MAHNGDWAKVRDYAKAAKACGVDVLKLQCHLPEESSELEQWRVDPGTGESRLHYWTRTAWDVATWRQVGQIIHDAGLEFGCSVFCDEAALLMAQVPEMNIWKIPSGAVRLGRMARFVCGDKRPRWVSTGLARECDIRAIQDLWQPHVIMNCTSLYPCQPEQSGLGFARTRFGYDPYGSSPAWGWSDHTGDPALIYAAIGAGATVVEVHFELGHEDTPDSHASWLPARLTSLVQGIRRIEQGLASTDKDKIAAACAHLRPYYVPTRLNGRVAKHHGQGEAI